EGARRVGLDHARGTHRTVQPDGELDLDFARGARAQRLRRIARCRGADRAQVGGAGGRAVGRGLGLPARRFLAGGFLAGGLLARRFLAGGLLARGLRAGGLLLRQLAGRGLLGKTLLFLALALELLPALLFLLGG